MRKGPYPGRPGMSCHGEGGLFDEGRPSPAVRLEEVADVLERGGAVDGYGALRPTEADGLWWDAVGSDEADGDPPARAPASWPRATRLPRPRGAPERSRPDG
ncbi:hypothetical protein ABT282_32140 [Streptomyces sp. NPDC000927]|uniref:hypothetical protein n=1 Tax=Streptomyces sp. NPDC000927 TaxID=3154371 RepID=UPI003317087F